MIGQFHAIGLGTVNATPAVHVSCYYGPPLILKHETGMCVGGDDNSYVSLF